MNERVQILALRATDRAPTGDASAFRRRLTHALAGFDLHPPGMPPAAVLIVRKLADPLPGVLDARRAATTTSLPAAWERAGRAALDFAWRHAARPADGTVANDAPAVAFADEGEWLACRLDDLAGQRARWWWRAAGAASMATTIATVALAHRRSLPAAIAHLAEQGRAVTVVSRIGAGEALALCARLAADAGLPAVHAGSAPVGGTAAVVGAEAARAPHAARLPGEVGHRHATQPAEFAAAVLRLAARAQVDLASLPLPQRLLLALAVGLQRWPQALRTEAARAPEPLGGDAPRALRHENPASARHGAPGTASERAAQRRQDSPHSPETLTLNTPSPPTPLRASESARTAPPVAKRRAATRTDRRPERQHSVASATSASPVPVPPARRPTDNPLIVLAATADHGDSEFSPAAPAGSDGRRQRIARPPPADDGAARTTQVAATRAAGVAGTTIAEARRNWPDDGLASELAGAGFLINLMRHLDLPDAFEPRFALTRRLGPWATLAALAAGLADDPAPHDPLWAALTALAGPAPPSDAASPVFRWPPGWLARAGSGAARRHPAPLPTACATRVGPTLAPVFTRLLPVVAERLQRALGDETPAALLRRPGRIYLTSTHLDLVLPLAAISLAARRAGLDRDPGWLPAWGRVVLFHFA